MRLTLLVVVSAVALVVALLVLVAIPRYAIQGPRHAVESPGLTVAERLDAENDLRGTLVQAAGALFVVAGLIYTAKTFRETREANITERYATAVDQLGSDKVHVRLGAIYSLERLGRDSERDRATIADVLSAVVRYPHSRESDRTAPEDVSAAVSVLSRFQAAGEVRILNLRGADLTYLRLPDLQLRNADLRDVNLTRAHLPNADLRGARLDYATAVRADLAGAVLSGANLTRAKLSAAVLRGTALDRTTLRGAQMTFAVLGGANLADADLSGADMTGAQLRADDLGPSRVGSAVFAGATLKDADVRGVDLRRALGLTAPQKESAISDDDTQWPDTTAAGSA